MPRDPELFEVGMGVFLADRNAGGFYTTVGTIVSREGDRFYLDQALHHDYMPGAEATVSSLFPLVQGRGIAEAAIENLVLDGNIAETRTLNGCRGGGVFLLRSNRVGIRNVEVRHYNGDGISFQQCTDIVVQACRVHDNRGGGLHPGSGSVRYVMEENHLHHNGGYGLFYCLRTTHSRCARNTIEWNGRAGISIGEMDTDHWICHNTVAHNGGPAIEFREPILQSGDRVYIEENRFVSNRRAVSNGIDAEIVIPENLHDIAIVNNRFETAGKAVRIGAHCERIRVADNHINGQDQNAGDLIGASGGRADDFSLTPPDLAGLPLNGARHLGIPQLNSWMEP
jgi:hypothetical protein